MRIKMMTMMVLFSYCSLIQADTLLRNGRYETIKTDSSDMTFGGSFYKYTAGNGCSYNTYYDRCENDAIPSNAERVWVSEVGKDSYILSADTIVYCGRYRTISNCIQTNVLGTTTTTSTSYGGVTRIQKLVSDTDGISSINLQRSIDGACTTSCTDTLTGEIRKGVSEETCAKVARVWQAINDDYREACATKEICNKIEVLEACEGTKTGELAGIYIPAPMGECTSSDVDQARSKYIKQKEGGGYSDVYLYFGRNRWIFNQGFCNSIGIKTGTFEAGDEPFQNPETKVSCYNGGYTSNKSYKFTNLQIQCIDNEGDDTNKSGESSSKFNERNTIQNFFIMFLLISSFF